MKCITGMFLVLISTAASAYILPPSYFTKEWMEQNKSLQSILIRQDRQEIAGDAIVQTTQEVVKIRRPGMVRISNDKGDVKILGKDKAFVSNQGMQRLVPLQELITPPLAFIVYNQETKLDSALKQIGLDVSQYENELVEEQVGGKTEKSPKIRIGPKNGNRLYAVFERIQNPEKTKDEQIEIPVLDGMVWEGLRYQFKYDRSKLSNYPTQIDVYDGETLRERIYVRSVTLNPKISDSEFEK